jgi:methionyl aminopeptidase
MPRFEFYTPDEIIALRESGKVLRTCLEHVASLVRPGVTTGELDAAAEAFIRAHGGVPAFKGYNGYPSTLCTSVNEECVHGMPGKRVLQEGDIVSLDGGVKLKNMITDACITVPVGRIDAKAQHVIRVAEEALAAGIREVRAGARVGQISAAIQAIVEKAGYTPIPALTGHGVGRAVHLYPDVPNRGRPDDGPALPDGTVIAIEPIVAVGKGDVIQLADGWTMVTADGSLSTHAEHTVLVTLKGCEILA